ncbi:MAG: replication-associated protein [Cressdnaviricota sp.]|nr:MAG: replication-associated protein [Cressdnaviricota sp.]
MPGGQCATWDITADAGRNPAPFLIGTFKEFCKKWAFQTEEAPTTGWLHQQCRISLHKKTTESCVVKLLTAKDVEGFHVTPTSSNACKGAPFYVMKDETRIEGPWTDKDIEPIPSTRTSRKLDEEGLLPWQNQLMLEATGYNDRQIHCVIDKEGDHGKGALCKWCYVHGYACLVPPFNSPGDLIQFVNSRPVSELYMIDMPRAMPKKYLNDLYTGIETLKDGYIYDKRYRGQFKLIDEPNIIVFTNTPPKRGYLTANRWKMWTIRDNELEVYTYPVVLTDGHLEVVYD